MDNEEFYIGWQGNAPKRIATHIKRTISFITIGLILIALLLGINQRKFSTGNFEFGKLTEVTGIYSAKPVPSLLVAGKQDVFNHQPIITIPLIGFGKLGADGVVRDLEKNEGISLDGLQLTLKGTLLYNDGKLLMQIDGNDKPLVRTVKLERGGGPFYNAVELGELSLKGEIVDPKCYFGVMKPGQGKPHKDCAIRCILGGIPPTLRVVDEEGRASYYLIVGEDGEPMNKVVQRFVAEPVSLRARAVKVNDWILLYTRPESIEGISRRELFFSDTSIIACAANSH